MVRNKASRRTEKTHSPDEELANGIVVVLLPRGTGCSSQLATKHMSARRVLNEAHAEGHSSGPRRGAGPLGRREQPHTEIQKKINMKGAKKKLGNAAGQARVMPVARRGEADRWLQGVECPASPGWHQAGVEWAGAERWLSNSRPGGPAATRGLEALAYFLVVRGRLAGGPHGPTGRTAPGRGAARAGASATEGEGPA